MSVLCRRQLPFIGPGQRLTPLNPMVIRRSKPAKCTYCCQGLNKNEVMRSRVEVRRALEKIAVRRLPLVSVKCALTAGTALAAAATSGYLHAAVTSTITNVAITAVAIASGACLSTKIDCLWPRGEQGPESVELDGVDVTGYTIFSESKVQKAATFARKAHSGQTRKTGEPYLTHCIHTGKILAALVPSSGQRAINTVVAGILHDVIDDTGENLQTVEQNFGDDVASLVAGVSKLSYINQLLRRHRRTNALENGDLALAEMDNLRVMLLGMVDDPRVVLIKLADRLHNMRTIYALPPSKAQAVAQETLAVWCSLASRLGLWAIKSELEDLCFAVLHPQVFRNLRAELAAMWTPSREQRYLRRIMESARHRRSLHGSKDDFNLVKKDDFHTDDGERIKELIQGVQPFELLLDRGKRSHILSNFAKNTTAESMKPKIVHDAEIAIASLTACEEAIEKELVLSTSYIPGMEVTLSGRLKSLYSTYCKMKRKQVSIDHIYDVRALRVIVGDGGGKMHAAAVECCYSLLNVIHSLWTPLDGEFDDYIVNPKPSGYQSLHTAVKGPDGSPLEVQVRTQCMHESAEYGHAAHWLYKEARNIGRCISFPDDANNIILPNGNDIIGSTSQETQKDADKELYPTVNSIRAGHPVLRIEDSRLLVAVVVRVNDGGKELLVAASFALAASEAVAAGRLSNQTKRWEAYAKLYKKVSEKWWFAPGHGDWNTFIEKYVLCRDGIYHKQDQFQRSLPTFIQLIDLSMEENEEYWKVMSTVLEGKEIDGGSSSSSCSTSSTIVTPVSAISTTTHLNNKVRLLRSMLEWEQQLRNEVVFGTASASSPTVPKSAVLTEVAIIRWPDGDIMRMKFGSTAADAARRLGMDGRFVFVNGQVALPHTQLKDGDVVEVRT